MLRYYEQVLKQCDGSCQTLWSGSRQVFCGCEKALKQVVGMDYIVVWL